MAKIAAADNSAMNRLYAQELKQAGIKTANEEDNADPVAFADHKKYLDTLEAILKSDKKDSFSQEERDITLD